MKSEVYADGRIVVERAKFDATIMADAGKELDLSRKYNDLDGIRYGNEVVQIPMSYGFVTSPWIPGLEFNALQQILLQIGVDKNTEPPINCNFQPPYSEQYFHIDSPKVTASAGMLAVVHCADGGRFDFSPDSSTPEQAFGNFESILELCAGDVVYQLSKTIPHRGVNTSGHSRVTFAVPLPFCF